MPGPIIRDTTPEWLKPENASVLDSPLVKAVRALATVTGMNDPAQGVFGAMNPMPMIGLVPRQPVSGLVKNLASGSEMPESVRKAVVHLAERYPRLMSHVAYVDSRAALNEGERIAQHEAGAGPVTKGRYRSSPGSNNARSGARPRGRIGDVQVDSRVIGSDSDALNTVAHEVTHAAQDLRQTDRSWRNLDPAWYEEYARTNMRAGYQKNPYEVAARSVGGKQAKEAVFLRPIRTALESGMTPEQVKNHMFDSYGTALYIGDVDGKGVDRLIRVAQTMMQRAKE